MVFCWLICLIDNLKFVASAKCSVHVTIKVYEFVILNESLLKIAVKNANNCYKMLMSTEY